MTTLVDRIIDALPGAHRSADRPAVPPEHLPPLDARRRTLQVDTSKAALDAAWRAAKDRQMARIVAADEEMGIDGDGNGMA